jgi:hypothetical protein
MGRRGEQSNADCTGNSCCDEVSVGLVHGMLSGGRAPAPREARNANSLADALV